MCVIRDSTSDDIFRNNKTEVKKNKWKAIAFDKSRKKKLFTELGKKLLTFQQWFWIRLFPSGHYAAH